MKEKILGKNGEIVFVDKYAIQAIHRTTSFVKEDDFEIGIVEYETCVCNIVFKNGGTIQMPTNLTPREIEVAILMFEKEDALALNEIDYEIARKRQPLLEELRGIAVALQSQDFGKLGESREEYEERLSELSKELANLKYSYERFE